MCISAGPDGNKVYYIAYRNGNRPAVGKLVKAKNLNEAKKKVLSGGKNRTISAHEQVRRGTGGGYKYGSLKTY